MSGRLRVGWFLQGREIGGAGVEVLMIPILETNDILVDSVHHINLKVLTT